MSRPQSRLFGHGREWFATARHNVLPALPISGKRKVEVEVIGTRIETVVRGVLSIEARTVATRFAMEGSTAPTVSDMCEAQLL
jgi:hypothetical protein